MGALWFSGLEGSSLTTVPCKWGSLKGGRTVQGDR